MVFALRRRLTTVSGRGKVLAPFPLEARGNVRRLFGLGAADIESLVIHIARLLRLQVEFGVAEIRELAWTALTLLIVAFTGAVGVVAALVVLLAGVLAPLFGARWEHLIVAGAAALVLSGTGLAWTAWRVQRLFQGPKAAVALVQENWRWLEMQLRSRLISH